MPTMEPSWTRSRTKSTPNARNHKQKPNRQQTTTTSNFRARSWTAMFRRCWSRNRNSRSSSTRDQMWHRAGFAWITTTKSFISGECLEMLHILSVTSTRNLPTTRMATQRTATKVKCARFVTHSCVRFEKKIPSTSNCLLLTVKEVVKTLFLSTMFLRQIKSVLNWRVGGKIISWNDSPGWLRGAIVKKWEFSTRPKERN